MEGQADNAESKTPTAQPTTKKAPLTRTRVHSKYVLPSDRHPFSVHFEILRRFVIHTRNGAEPIPAERVESEGIPVQAASMNVRFLSSIGLLKFDSKGLYLPTQDTIRFVNAKSVSDERARPILREVLKSAWFTELALHLLQTRPLMSDDQFVGELALAAETDKARKEPALQVILEYLVYAGILSRDDRGLALGQGSAPAPASEAPSPFSGGTPSSSVGAASTQLRGSNSPDRMTDQTGWHVVQTEDYYLKVRSDPEIITELNDQIELLKKKIARLRAKTEVKSDEAESPG